MTFEVELNGRVRTVSVERTGDSPGQFRITVDGAEQFVDAVRLGEYGLSLLTGKTGTLTVFRNEPEKTVSVPVFRNEPEKTVSVPVFRRSREVYVTPGRVPGELLITLEGRSVVATVNGRRTGRAADAAAQGHGEQTVTAPMPGRVVRVLVTTGDEVQARQGVVVVEAMKMENELRAPKGGRVKDVAVTPGMSVEAGRTLVVIE